MDKRFKPVDEEERALMAAIDRDEWHPIQDLQGEKKRVAAIARNTLKKNRRVNLRMTETDFIEINERALEEGIPYQTLITSIVHKYLNGTLVPKRRDCL